MQLLLHPLGHSQLRGERELLGVHCTLESRW
jgi:hypothetical protein